MTDISAASSPLPIHSGVGNAWTSASQKHSKPALKKQIDEWYENAGPQHFADQVTKRTTKGETFYYLFDDISGPKYNETAKILFTSQTRDFLKKMFDQGQDLNNAVKLMKAKFDGPVSMKIMGKELICGNPYSSSDRIFVESKFKDYMKENKLKSASESELKKLFEGSEGQKFCQQLYNERITVIKQLIDGAYKTLMFDLQR